jgi:hypothetical protein
VVGPGVDPLGQEVTVFAEEAFARGMTAKCLAEALRFYVGGDDAVVQRLDSYAVKPDGELLEQLTPEAVTMLFGVDVQRPTSAVVAAESFAATAAAAPDHHRHPPTTTLTDASGESR